MSRPDPRTGTRPLPPAPGTPRPAFSAALTLTLALAFVLLSGPVGAATGPAAEAGAGAAESPTAPPREKHVLEADHWWVLNLPEGRRLDASGLMRLPDGAFVVVNDQDARLHRFEVSDTTRELDLTPVPDPIPPEKATELIGNSRARLDLEGIARDDAGRWYLSEEARRWIFRWDPVTRALERLEIDWSPVRRYFHPTDLNASFEGIAIDGRRLYVANERQTGRILVVDLDTLRVVDHFTVAPAGSVSPDTHFSDLCWAEGSLWALLRDVRKVLRIDPVRHTVLAEFEYEEMENAAESGYGLLFAPGFMEGLWVDAKYLWLLVDNNGFNRRGRPGDARPTLFRCVRPDRR